MNVLVTGGSGFIGTRLVERLLESGHQPRIFDKRGSGDYPDLVIIGDVRDAGALEKASAGCEIAYHLAAEHHDNVRPVSLYRDVNVGGAVNLVAAAEATGIREIVFTSTVAVYGLNADTPGEDSPLAPFNEYGVSKAESERVFEDWMRLGGGRRLVTVRPTVIFGERNRGNVYNLLNQIRGNRFVMVGNGLNRKSMGYVGNIAEFLVFAVGGSEAMSVFNYADKPDMTTLELVQTVRRAFGMDPRVSFRLPYHLGLAGGAVLDAIAALTRTKLPVSAVRIRKFCADTSIRTDRLEASGFRQPYTLEDGLKRMIESEFAS